MALLCTLIAKKEKSKGLENRQKTKRVVVRCFIILCFSSVMAEICYFGGLVHYKSPSLPLSLHSLFRSKKPHYYNSTSLMAECLSSSTVEPPSLLVFSGSTFFLFLVSWVSLKLRFLCR